MTNMDESLEQVWRILMRSLGKRVTAVYQERFGLADDPVAEEGPLHLQLEDDVVISFRGMTSTEALCAVESERLTPYFATEHAVPGEAWIVVNLTEDLELNVGSEIRLERATLLKDMFGVVAGIELNLSRGTLVFCVGDDDTLVLDGGGESEARTMGLSPHLHLSKERPAGVTRVEIPGDALQQTHFIRATNSNVLPKRDAYRVMYAYLWKRWERNPSNVLRQLLADMALPSDGSGLKPSIYADWVDAIRDVGD